MMGFHTMVRDVRGFEGSHRVTDQGVVLSVARRCRTANPYGESTRRVPAKVLAVRYDAWGCAVVKLCADGVAVSHHLSSLVLEAFVGSRPPGHFAEHVNGDPRDCRLENLRWAPRLGQARFRPGVAS
jgi:hypothetical protein